MSAWVDKLLKWYGQTRRDLPWRTTQDPYRIWISEIMLQQTRVDTVQDYYHRFIECFPTVTQLAEAPPEQVFKVWAGLGYYSRARNLHKAAGIIQENYQGQLPSTYEELRGLPGIGEYTAGAVMSIAYGKPYPAIDGNVNRVMSRLFALPEVYRPEVSRQIRARVAQHFPEERVSDYTQALMELGALICIPRYPLCPQCPIHDDCQAYQQDRQNEWPCSKQKPVRREENRCIALVQREERVLLHRRPNEGLLGGLWEFPSLMGTRQGLAGRFQEHFGLPIKVGKLLLSSSYSFSHLTWNMKVYACSVQGQESGLLPGLEWVDLEHLRDRAIPTAYREVVHLLRKEAK